MTRLAWDEAGDRFFETGVSKGVLFPMTGINGAYDTGVPWNGLTAVTESPSGAEQTPLYADNIKYLSLTSVEELGVTIEAYTYPDEFGVCDGSVTPTDKTGVILGQQPRVGFGLTYQTKLGNDVDGDAYGYKIHILYGCKASPSERAYATVNDSPEAITFSWEVTTTPTEITGQVGTNWRPVSLITIDSTKVVAEDLTALEDLLYGDATTGTSTLPTPAELLALFSDPVQGS